MQRKPRKKSSSQQVNKELQKAEQADTLVSIVEYRKLLKDIDSTDQEILFRLQYLETLCRYIIKKELQDYAEKS